MIQMLLQAVDGGTGLFANIPATVTYLPTDAGRRDGTKLPTGAVQGRNDFGYAGFGGACPPKGDKPHHYQFKVLGSKN